MPYPHGYDLQTEIARLKAEYERLSTRVENQRKHIGQLLKDLDKAQKGERNADRDFRHYKKLYEEATAKLKSAGISE